MDSGGQVLIARLCPLRPDRAQALVGHNHPEQLLGRKGCVTQPCHIPDLCPQFSPVPGSGDWSELAFRKLGMCPEPCVSPCASSSAHRGHPAPDDPGPRTGGEGRRASSSSCSLFWSDSPFSGHSLVEATPWALFICLPCG